MFELIHSPYIAYIAAAIGFTLGSMLIMTIKAQRAFIRVQKELLR